MIPAALIAAIGMRRHRRWARTAAYVVIGWFALVPAAVAAMAIVMTVNDDPNASTGATAMFVAAATVFTVGAASLYRPLFDTDASDHGRTKKRSHSPARFDDPVDPRAHHQTGVAAVPDREPISPRALINEGQDRS